MSYMSNICNTPMIIRWKKVEDHGAFSTRELMKHLHCCEDEARDFSSTSLKAHSIALSTSAIAKFCAK